MCPTLTVGPLFCSFVQQRQTSTISNLNNFKPQQLQPQKRVQNEKNQNRRPEPQTKNPHMAPLFSAL